MNGKALPNTEEDSVKHTVGNKDPVSRRDFFNHQTAVAPREI